MGATLYGKEDPNVRPWNKPEPPATDKQKPVVGPHPRGQGECPKCGKTVARLAIHMRKCAG